MSMLRSAVRALDEGERWRSPRTCSRATRNSTAEYATALRQLMSYVMQDHRFLKPTIDTMFALKGLERVGDHAKNIAEQVLYMIAGRRRMKPTPREGRDSESVTRSNSLMPTLARVFASTCFTITAQYKRCTCPPGGQ